MSFIDVITSSDVIIAIFVYGGLALIEPFFETWLHGKFTGNVAFQWGWDQFFAPLTRSVMLIVFVWLAYPGLFGLRVAPTVTALLAGDGAQVSTLISAMFFVGFAASLIPGISRRTAFVLPIQGCLAGGYIFSRLAAYLGVTTAIVWPGLDVVLSMMLLSYFGHKFARVLGRAVGVRVDGHMNTRGYDVAITNAIELLNQIVVLSLFGYGLGRQLAI